FLQILFLSLYTKHTYSARVGFEPYGTGNLDPPSCTMMDPPTLH
ncbi:hypothetical protein TGAM01_v204535, partial [Trichoderma gamsii]